MRNLRQLTDDELWVGTLELVTREREVTLSVLHHLREVERRCLDAARGFSSLFEYAVKELRYSEGSAYRRILSVRLLKELPELEEKIENGSLGLSTLAQAQKFFRQEKTAILEQREILSMLEGHSAREVERTLAAKASVQVAKDAVTCRWRRRLLNFSFEME